MIDLNGVKPFAEGGNRKCFINPQNPNQCLKVLHPGLLEKLNKDRPWYKKARSLESFDDNLREKEGYEQRALKSKNPEIWKHLAKWYGLQETSLGLASVTELIHNNGQIAETLEDYLFNKGLTEEIRTALKVFEKWLKENLVLTKNLIPHNLVLKNEVDGITIKIIDGLGCHAFIPLPQNTKFFAKIYVNKRIELMWSRINWDISGRKGNWK